EPHAGVGRTGLPPHRRAGGQPAAAVRVAGRGEAAHRAGLAGGVAAPGRGPVAGHRQRAARHHGALRAGRPRTRRARPGGGGLAAVAGRARARPGRVRRAAATGARVPGPHHHQVRRADLRTAFQDRSGGTVTGTLAVVGAGTMGTGIAALAVGHGVPTVLVDVDEAALRRAQREVPRQVRLGQLMGGLPRGAAGALTTTTTLDDIAGATAVVECVTERADLKAKVLAECTPLVADGTPVLTNTSAIPVDELAQSAVRPGDVLGAHFMNPPYLIRTVEVIRGPRTAETVLAKGLDLLAALTREPVVVGDAP